MKKTILATLVLIAVIIGNVYVSKHTSTEGWNAAYLHEQAQLHPAYGD